MASGGDDIGNINTSPPQEAYVLYGAVVGGPDKHGRFFDIRSDWPETEASALLVVLAPVNYYVHRSRWIITLHC
jgi:endoglucanase